MSTLCFALAEGVIDALQTGCAMVPAAQASLEHVQTLQRMTPPSTDLPVSSASRQSVIFLASWEESIRAVDGVARWAPGRRRCELRVLLGGAR